MLATAAVNLGMASMTLPSKQPPAPATPPALPARSPVGITTPTSPRPSLFPAGPVPPPLPILPPKGSRGSLESTDLDDDCKYFLLPSFQLMNFSASIDLRNSYYTNINNVLFSRVQGGQNFNKNVIVKGVNYILNLI